MSDLSQTFLAVPLWLWLMGVIAIILITMAIARFFGWWRKRRVELAEVTIQVPGVEAKFAPTTPPSSADSTTPSISVNTAGGPAQVSTGAGARNIQTGGAPYIEHAVVTLPSEHPPEPKPYAPSLNVEIYVQRGIEDQVRARLLQTGVAAIVGIHAPGGTGKTELAKYVSRSLRDEFGEPVWVDLGDKTPDQIIGDCALAVGAQLSPNANYAQRCAELHAHLQKRKILIVLDDVREANRAALADFLPPSPPCAAIVTSRIHELSHAIAVNARFDLGNMNEKQARELLTAALGAERVNAESNAVERLIARVKGNPLALDIAARRIFAYREHKNPVAFYLAKLEQRLDELKAGDDPRLNWEAVMDLSYNDLTPADQKRFRALAVFSAKGCTVRAAQFVWNDDADAAREAIARLHNFSLLKLLDTPEERYRLHDLLDEYALKKLRAHGEENETNDRHAEYLVQLFTEHYTDDPSTAPQIVPELENLRAAIQWARATQNGKRLAQLVTTPRNWFVVLNWYAEWYTWIRDALRIGKDYDRWLEANVRKAMGDVQQFRDERDAALASYAQALELFRAVGDRLGEANVLAARGQLFLLSDPKQADTLLNQAIQIYNQIGSRYSVPAQIGNFGWVLLRLGKPDRVRPYLLRAAELFEQMGLMDYAERHRRAAQ